MSILDWLTRIVGFENARRVMWLACFLRGHDVKSGEVIGEWVIGYAKITPDYCDRCIFTSDEIDLEDRPVTLPYLLNRAYSWVVEREWTWFEKVDSYLLNHHAKRLPHWWSY